MLVPTRTLTLFALAGALALGLSPENSVASARVQDDEPAASEESSESEGLPSIDEATEGLRAIDGFVSLRIDDTEGKVSMIVPGPDPEAELSGEAMRLLWVEGLTGGLGANDIGLDRGQIGGQRILVLRHMGGKVLFEEPNLDFRARTSDPLEADAVRESFASSVHWSAKPAARDEDGSVLIDLTPFLLMDAHGVVGKLRGTDQGSYRLDGDRCALDLDQCLAFPDNVEFEALLTYAGDDPGRHVRASVPTGQAITLIQHHSFIRLPDTDYEPRNFDPRTGSFALSFLDYSVPLTESMEVRWATRHRLEKTDPTAAVSPVKEPIVYYIDSGAPEPVRSALVEGGNWWAEAFEAAGFQDAFRVEVMPEGMHPLDVRYNVVQWVHRSTRGWSYGGSIRDPRTGEILKGIVSLGSLRVRQDRLLFEGLAGTEKTGSGAADDPVQLALARLRQLSAHEIGHTIGMAHNFAASTYGRASVMDYPVPRVSVDETGRLDFSEAYGVGVGAWDKHAIRWLYSEFPQGADEKAELDRIAQEGIDAGLIYLSDADARPAGAADPRANLWDDGADPIAALEQALLVREVALANFGTGNLPEGRPLAMLQEVLAPVYLFHRYQVDAVVKYVGGFHYQHALRGDGQGGAMAVDTGEQVRALAALNAALDPAGLDLPDAVLDLLLPRPSGYGSNRELFSGSNAPGFDGLAAAEAAANQVLRGVLQPERCARVLDQNRRDARFLELDVVIDRLLTGFFINTPRREDPRTAEIRRRIERAAIHALMDLASSTRTSPGVRDVAEGSLVGLQTRMANGDKRVREGFHHAYLVREIQRFLDREDAGQREPDSPKDLPPGSPIGHDAWQLEHCSCGPFELR